MSFCVHSIRIFSKFSDDPYYEPLSWFMILLLMQIAVLLHDLQLRTSHYNQYIHRHYIKAV